MMESGWIYKGLGSKEVTYWGPIVFPENVLVDIIKKLLFKLKNNLNQRQERNRALINNKTNVKCA